MNRKLFTLSPLLLLAASLAQGAQPAASFTCTTNSGNLSFNVSYFNIGADTPTSTSAGSGSVAGKVTLLPLTLYASLGTFEMLFQAAVNGATYPSCVLSTTASNGDNIQFTIKNAIVSNVSAVAA